MAAERAFTTDTTGGLAPVDQRNGLPKLPSELEVLSPGDPEYGTPDTTTDTAASVWDAGRPVPGVSPETVDYSASLRGSLGNSFDAFPSIDDEPDATPAVSDELLPDASSNHAAGRGIVPESLTGKLRTMMARKSARTDIVQPERHDETPRQPRVNPLIKFLSARDMAYAETPYKSPYSTDMGDHLRGITRQLWETEVPELVRKSEIGEWLSRVALTHAAASYGEQLRTAKLGPIDRRLQTYMPNRARDKAGRHLEELAERAASVGIGAVIDRGVSTQEAVRRAFRTLGDVEVHRFPLDDRDYVLGTEIVRVLQKYRPDEPGADQVSPAVRGRKDDPGLLSRDNGSEGEIYKNIVLSVEDLNDNKVPRTSYAVGIGPAWMSTPNRERNEICEVAAVAVKPHMVPELNVHINNLEFMRASMVGRNTAQWIGSRIVVDVEKAHDYLTDPGAIGVVSEPKDSWGRSIGS